MTKSGFEAKNVAMRLAHSLGLSVIYRYIGRVVRDEYLSAENSGSILPLDY